MVLRRQPSSIYFPRIVAAGRTTTPSASNACDAVRRRVHVQLERVVLAHLLEPGPALASETMLDLLGVVGATVAAAEGEGVGAASVEVEEVVEVEVARETGWVVLRACVACAASVVD